MSASERRRGDIAELTAWQTSVMTLKFHDVMTQHPDILKRAKASREQTFLEMLFFILFFATEYGRFGRGMRPTQVTAADGFGKGSSTVGRWLACAVELGLLAKVKEANRALGLTAEYDIAPFWEQTPAQAADSAGPFDSYAFEESRTSESDFVDRSQSRTVRSDETLGRRASSSDGDSDEYDSLHRTARRVRRPRLNA